MIGGTGMSLIANADDEEPWHFDDGYICFDAAVFICRLLSPLLCKPPSSTSWKINIDIFPIFQNVIRVERGFV